MYVSLVIGTLYPVLMYKTSLKESSWKPWWGFYIH